MKTYLLGIDNGGTVSKAALFDSRGGEVAVASRPVKILSPRPGWSERDAGQMWNETADAIREVIERSGVDPQSIAAVACTGHGNGLYLVDKQGDPVRNGINSSDGRAQSYIDRWIKTGVDARVLPWTTQSLWAAQPNALLAWIKDHEPTVFARADAVYMAKDFIRFRLTGECRAEITDMSGTSLMNVAEGRYDDRVLRAFGLEEVQALLPPLVESAEVAGRVTEAAAKVTGLAAGTLVVGGMFDIDACALASGLLNSGLFSIVAGTWGNNQYIARTPLVDKELFMTSRYAIPGWYLMLEGSPTSAGNLEWFLGTFLDAERKQMGEKAFFEYVSGEVAAVPPASSGVVFLPFLYGCNCGELKGGFFGLDSSQGVGVMLRAIFEGIVFAHFHHIERLLAFREFPEKIRLTGGAARNPLWCQMFADVIGIPVEIPKGSELGALGAAITAAVGAGIYRDIPEAVGAMTSIDKTYTPQPEMTAIYREKYARYRRLTEALKQV